MRIGIDVRCLESRERTGIGVYTHELLSHIFAVDATNEYYLFTNAFNPKSNLFHPYKTQTITTRIPNKLLTASTILFGYPKIDRLITGKIDTSLDIFFSPNLNFTALSPNTKHVLMIHDLSFIFFPEYYTRKQRWWHTLANIQRQARRAAHIITPSENTKNDVVRHLGVPPEKITVLNPGTTLPDEQSTLETRCKVLKRYRLTSPYILALGTAEPRKNMLAVITAFEQAATSLRTIPQLVFAGASGSLTTALQKRINTSPYRSNIRQIGFIPEADKPALLREAALCLYPSFYEGFGFPVLEALQSGVPIITSNRSSLPEVAGQHAYMVNPHYPLELAEAIVRIYNNQTIHTPHSMQAAEIARAFSWPSTAKKFLQLLKNLTDKNG